MVEAFITKGSLSFLSQEKWEDILSPFALAAEKVDSDRHYFWAVRKEIVAHYYHKNLEELEMDNLGRVKKIFLANPTSRGEAEQEYARFKGYRVAKRTRDRTKYNSVNIDFQAETRNYQLYP